MKIIQLSTYSHLTKKWCTFVHLFSQLTFDREEKICLLVFQFSLWRAFGEDSFQLVGGGKQAFQIPKWASILAEIYGLLDQRNVFFDILEIKCCCRGWQKLLSSVAEPDWLGDFFPVVRFRKETESDLMGLPDSYGFPYRCLEQVVCLCCQSAKRWESPCVRKQESPAGKQPTIFFSSSFF